MITYHMKWTKVVSAWRSAACCTVAYRTSDVPYLRWEPKGATIGDMDERLAFRRLVEQQAFDVIIIIIIITTTSIITIID